MELEKVKTDLKIEKQLNLDQAAMTLLKVLYSIDQGWKERDEACSAENGFGPAQRALKYMALVLDQGLHLNVLHGYDFIEPGTTAKNEIITPMHGTCPQCQKPFDRKFPGQVCCSNECGTAHFGPLKFKTPEYGDSFDQAMEEMTAAVLNEQAPMTEPGRSGGAIPIAGTVR